MFTEPDESKRQQLTGVFQDLINLAADFSQMVNIGRVRGFIYDAPREEAEGRFLDMARHLCDYAAPKGVTLVLEPVNRYEIDFINSVGEGAELMTKVDRPNMKLMPDVFHMNIEDRTIGGELARHVDHVGYVHPRRLEPTRAGTGSHRLRRHLRAPRKSGVRRLGGPSRYCPNPTPTPPRVKPPSTSAPESTPTTHDNF